MGAFIIFAVICIIVFYIIKGVTQSLKKYSPSKSDNEQTSIKISFEVSNNQYVAIEKDSLNLKWLAENQTFNLKGETINTSLVYYSDKSVSEPSCINRTLPIGIPAEEPKGSLGYWPSYSGITAIQRANYIKWLKSGRNSDLSDIGYVFIYFYGLERRAIVEQKDIEIILKEVIRLLNRYSFSSSFNSYATRFIIYLSVKFLYNINLNDFNIENISLNILFPPYFAQLYKNNKLLDKELAYLYAKSDFKFKRSIVIERVGENFKKLFDKKFEEKYGQGIVLIPNKRLNSVSYHPATILSHNYNISDCSIIDISQSSFIKLEKIWDECIEELTPLSRTLARGPDISAREAYKKLPKILQATTVHPDKEKWDEILKASIKKGEFNIIKMGSVMEALDMPISNVKISKKDCISIVENAEEIGLASVPDVRLTSNTCNFDDYICFFKGGPLKITQAVGSEYMTIVRFLEIAMAMGNVNSKIDESEINYINNSLSKKFNINDENRKRLEAYKELFLLNPPSLKIVSKLKTKLNMEQKEELVMMMIGVVLSDNFLDKEEFKALKNLFKSLGIEEYKLYKILFDMKNQKESPVEFIGIEEKDFPEDIRQQIANIGNTVSALNYDKIRKIQNETHEVSKILSDALSSSIDIEAEIIEVSDKDDIKSENIKLKSLDQRYHDFIFVLVTKNEWSKKDFIDITKQYGLMPASTIEVINTWADETLGDFIILEEEDYIINKNILEKML